MGLVEDDDAIGDHILICWEEVGVEEVIVWHEEESGDIFDVVRVKIGAKTFLHSHFSHYRNIDKLIR